MAGYGSQHHAAAQGKQKPEGLGAAGQDRLLRSGDNRTPAALPGDGPAEYGKDQEPPTPPPRLLLHGQAGLDEQRVAGEGEQGGKIRQGKQPVGRSSFEAARIPGSQQRSGGRESKVG